MSNKTDRVANSAIFIFLFSMYLVGYFGAAGSGELHKNR